MPFAIPSVAKLTERILADVESRLPEADLSLPNSVLRAIATSAASVQKDLHDHIAWTAKQILVDSAELEFLERHASIYGIVRKAATFAAGTADFTGTDGTVIPAGTALQRLDGVAYTTDAEATVAAGVASAAVSAAAAGAGGNAAAAATLELISPIAGVEPSAAAAAGGLTGGADAETDAQLRARVLRRRREPPHGGAAFDYVTWALEVAGVTRAWSYENHLGAGTVGVAFVKDDDPVSIIPGAGDLTAVADYIDNHEDPLTGLTVGRPVTAAVTVFAPVAVDLDLTIALSPDSQAVRDAVTANLTALLKRDAEPGATIYRSRLSEAISLATGEEHHAMTAPAADVAHDPTEIAVLGTITWT